MRYLLGIDIGTTSTKAVLFARDGKLVHRAAADYPLHSPEPGVAVQDADEIFRAVLLAVRKCVTGSGVAAREIGFASFSSAMHSVIAVDAEGDAISPVYTWADNRSARYSERLKRTNGMDIYRRTGTPIHPMAPLSKLMWLKSAEPELFGRAKKFISIKEYVFHKWFGDYVIDHSIASATGMFNLNDLDWDAEALSLAGVTPVQLSRPVKTTEVFRGIRADYAEAMGIDADLPVVIGASDGVLANVGVGALERGVVAVTIGTSGAVRTVTDRPVTDPKGRLFCYALTENHWVVGGPVNNGGMIFRWVRDQIGVPEIAEARARNIDPYELLTELAATVPPGSDGLLFHPFLAGERAPLWDANARGSYFGLGLHHTRAHLVRSALEGIIYNLYTVLLALEEVSGTPKRIEATGGFARSAFWRQMMADVFDQPVNIPESIESSCFGAVVLGLYALGEIDSLDVGQEMIGGVHAHTPEPEATQLYRELLPVYIRLGRLLTEEYAAIARFQEKHTKSEA
ncbi:gluconokinase [Exiguobacterium flavidum]|uniref:gluconokinase n=1 Tax=Exiguobacterium flavidum TaxID=2184695 RepID=UPI000DF8310B|nr:gluconokinase [Exiguobacterium flavidum]